MNRKKVGLIIVTVLSTLFVAHSQNLKVYVMNSIDQALPGTYIYVNNNGITATDSLGIAHISLSDLHVGDSISASYITANVKTVAVDSAMLVKGEYQFILLENYSTVQAADVRVKANVKRLYRKSLTRVRRQPYQLYGTYSSHFAIDITLPGDSVPICWVAGRVEGIYTPLSIAERLYPHIYSSTLAHPFNPNPYILDSLQRAKSRVERKVIGTIFSFEHLTNGTKLRTELKVKDHRIHEYEDSNRGQVTATLNAGKLNTDPLNASINTSSLNRKINNANMDFSNFSYFATWQIPTEVRHSITESDGAKVDITMSNIYIESLFEKEKIDFRTFFSQHQDRLYSKRTAQWDVRRLMSYYYNEMNYKLAKILDEDAKLHKDSSKGDAESKK